MSAAHRALLQRLGLDPERPFDPAWAAAADFLEHLADHVLAVRPQVIVECGSGLSTLVLAACCARLAQGRVYSLEHGPEFAAATRAELARQGLAAWARVLHTPLTDYPLHGETYPWYALTGLPAQPIALLVIDGPPGRLRPQARYPALPLLRARLAGETVIFLDDAARADEAAIVARWQAEFPGLHVEFLPSARGCARLSWATAPAQPGEAL